MSVQFHFGKHQSLRAVHRGLLLLTTVFYPTTNVLAETLPCAEQLAQAALPRNAYHLPAERALDLPIALADHGAVRLDPAGDYTKAFPLTLTSNQAVYGLAYTKVPKIIIAEGAQNVIVSGVWNDSIHFPPSDRITSQNCFNRIRTSIEVKNTKLENNLFIDFQGGVIDIDTSKKGYLRNNRFIKTLTHTAWPALTIRGNRNEPSSGNHFVWTNILGPKGDSVVIDQQIDITFTGIDIESWSWGKLTNEKTPTYFPAALNVSNTEFLSVFMAHGGNHRVRNAQYFNLDAENILLLGSDVEIQSSPGLNLGKQVKHVLAVNTLDIGHRAVNMQTKVVELFRDDSPDLHLNWRKIPSNRLDTPDDISVERLLKREHAFLEMWEKPTYLNPDNSQIRARRRTLPVYEEGTTFIQSLVDRHNIAQLEPGIYYLSKPIKLKDGQGIVGTGKHETILVAKTAAMDLIIGADHINNQLKSTWFILADLTLEGGRNGIHHAPDGAGSGAQFHRSIVTHVAFRNMVNAAIFLESIYAWDNNFLDNVDFLHCGAAIMQRPNPAYRGGDVPGTTYMDKNVCYRCRFEGNSIALDMPGKRGNGLNAFIDSEFRNNGKVLRAVNPLANFFANSMFINNRGNPILETNKPLGFIKSYFIQTTPGTIFGDNAFCNACYFDIRHPDAHILSPRPSNRSQRIFLISSNADPAISSSIGSGIILNEAFSNTTAPLTSSRKARSVIRLMKE